MSELDGVAQQLATVGLNRCQAISTSTLPSEVWLPGTRNLPIEQPTQSTLILVGHAGTAVWDHLTNGESGASLESANDPIDVFSIESTDTAIDRQWPDVGRRLLYPHPDCPVDLVALGKAIGWQFDSPLGLGIHPDWGLWSAYRALWELEAQLEPVAAEIQPGADVCAGCLTQNCVAACPAAAVSVGQRFNLAACFDYRAEQRSRCAETCLARRACPVGAEHRYSLQQMAYHYGISRPPVRRDG